MRAYGYAICYQFKKDVVTVEVPIIPPNALLDEYGNPLLNEDGTYLLAENPEDTVITEEGAGFFNEDGSPIIIE